jgi:hypothetical protein
MQALALLDQATRYVPDNRSILLAKVIALEVAAKAVEAEKLLKEIERRWPEWPEASLQGAYTVALICPGRADGDALLGCRGLERTHPPRC